MKIIIINQLISTVNILTSILLFLLFAQVLMSWVTMSGGRRRPSRLEGFLHDATEPIMRIIRKLPHKIGMIDISFIMAFIAIEFVSKILISLLTRIAYL